MVKNLNNGGENSFEVRNIGGEQILSNVGGMYPMNMMKKSYGEREKNLFED